MGDLCNKISKWMNGDSDKEERINENNQKKTGIIVQNQNVINQYYSMDNKTYNKINNKEKNEIYQLITKIEQDDEIDETKGYNINHIKEYVDSIFPENCPKNITRDITSQIYEQIKHIENTGEIKYMYELNNINKRESFYFICAIQKETKDTVNIVYKFKILNIDISKIKIGNRYKNIGGNANNNEEEELIHNAINAEKNKLKQHLYKN